MMTAWTHDELTRIGAADELEIVSLRDDGTLRKPVTIWVVRLGDDLYVRSVRGRGSAWFRGTQVRHAGHIQSGGWEICRIRQSFSRIVLPRWVSGCL
jgi:hypothetical protein